VSRVPLESSRISGPFPPPGFPSRIVKSDGRRSACAEGIRLVPAVDAESGIASSDPALCVGSCDSVDAVSLGVRVDDGNEVVLIVSEASSETGGKSSNRSGVDDLKVSAVEVLGPEGVSVMAGIRADGPSGSGPVSCAAVDARARASASGNLLPRFAARRRMPVAERPDSENLGGALGCKIELNVVDVASQTNDEDALSPLGHAEEASVENPVRDAVPEVDQPTEERRHVSPSMRGEKARNILEEDGGRSVARHKVEEGEGERGSLSAESAPFPGDAEVLTREAARPEGRVSPTRPRCVLLPAPNAPSVPTAFDVSSNAVGFVSSIGSSSFR
jgi:hypothetical protein